MYERRGELEILCYVRCMFKYGKPSSKDTFLFCDDQRPSSQFLFLHTFISFPLCDIHFQKKI